MAQKCVLEGAMDNPTFRGRGLVGRFIYCVPRSLFGTRQYEMPKLNYETQKLYENLMFTLFKLEGDFQLNLTSEAYMVYKKYFDWIEDRLVNEFITMRDWASKLHGTTLRIAALLHCIQHKDDLYDNLEVSEQTMKNAIEISKYLVVHAKKSL